LFHQARRGVVHAECCAGWCIDQEVDPQDLGRGKGHAIDDIEQRCTQKGENEADELGKLKPNVLQEIVVNCTWSQDMRHMWEALSRMCPTRMFAL
jgi:hypothetical protein